MISASVRSAIDETLRARLGPWGFRSAEVTDRIDHNGDPAIFIVARFVDPSRLPPSEATTTAMLALLDEVRSLGDDRFPYLDYVYPEQPIEDEAA